MESTRLPYIGWHIIEELVINDAEKRAEERRLALQKKQQDKCSREHRLVAEYLKRRFPQTFKEDMVARMTSQEFRFVLRKAKIRAFVFAPLRAIKKLFSVSYYYYSCIDWEEAVILFLVISFFLIIWLNALKKPQAIPEENTLFIESAHTATVEKTPRTVTIGEATRAAMIMSDSFIKRGTLARIARYAADHGRFEDAIRAAASMSDGFVKRETLAYVARKMAGDAH